MRIKKKASEEEGALMRVSNLHEAKKVPMVSVLPRSNSWGRGPLTKELFFIIEETTDSIKTVIAFMDTHLKALSSANKWVLEMSLGTKSVPQPVK